jgi:hypothetical protein
VSGWLRVVTLNDFSKSHKIQPTNRLIRNSGRENKNGYEKDWKKPALQKENRKATDPLPHRHIRRQHDFNATTTDRSSRNRHGAPHVGVSDP